MKPWRLAFGLLAWSLLGAPSLVPAANPSTPPPLPKGALRRLGEWSDGTGKRLRPDFRAIAFAPDGKTAATSHYFGIRLWDVATGKERGTIRRSECKYSYILAFAPDGKSLVSRAYPNLVVVWDVATGGKLRTLLNGDLSSGEALAFSSDGGVLTTIDAQKFDVIRLFDYATGKEVTGGRFRVVGATNVTSLAYSPDGRYLAGGLTNNSAAERKKLPGLMNLWDAVTGQLLHSFKGDARDCRADSPYFSPDGRILAYRTMRANPSALGPFARELSKDFLLPYISILRVCEVASGREIFQIELAKTDLREFAGSPDGRLLAAICYTEKDQGINLWDAHTGQLLRHFPSKTGIGSIAFSPASNILAMTTAYEGLLWDVGGYARGPKNAPALAPIALSRLWDDLASEDITAARRAVCSLVAIPDQTVPLLRDRLKPAVAKNAKQFAALIRDLDSNDFTVREKASAALEDQGRTAEPALGKALAAGPPLEVRRQIERLLKRLGPPIRSPRVLRTIRAQEVLEYAGTAEAQKVLQRMAAGAPGAPETEDARAALARLARRARTRR